MFHQRIEQAVQGRALVALQQQLGAVAAGAFLHRRGHRPQHMDVVQRRQPGGAFVQEGERLRHAHRLAAQQGEVAERRPAGAAPFFQQGIGERLIIAGGGQLHQVVVGMAALHQHPPGAVLAAAAAGHLQQQLGGLLRPAKVGAQETGVHIGDHRQAQAREMVALGEHLRAHQHRRLALLNLRQLGVQAALAAGGVAVDAHHRRAAFDLLALLFQQRFQFFRAGAGVGKVGGTAIAAAPWYPVLVAAVVAAQLLFAAVPGHQAVAARAFVLPAAVPAQNHRGEAAPVEEHQRLLAARQGVADRLEGGGQQRPVRGGVAGVEQFDGRRARVAGAAHQAQPVVAAGAGQVQGLQRRGGAAVHHRHRQLLGAPGGQVAGVVAETVLLFQRSVVGFVDDDQAGVGERREHRRAGADNNARPAVPGGHPGVQALAVGEAGVQHRHRHREALAEAAQGLGRQADLRHQHQHLFAGGQHRRHGLQVDLGLAAAGDAVEQERLEALGVDDGVDGGALFRVGGQGRLGEHLGGGAGGLRLQLHPFHPLLVAQCLQRRFGDRECLQHRRCQAVRVFL